ncbi:YidC/Oxa1 family membrane protein insertase [Chryseobacterium piscicola]|uniref:Membrane protein insertase YidC n=1 Tax=Chryseobacterium piscicola TaxID=551459 RepID=A0A1N7M7T8_9FLAO|nr:membrane protein insertase YidC [Chryseobacterium piscicola]PQA98205.1 membrane protein insertase YidC [Chryseobacterium piscicola]SIS82186.1 YidC/Oxa1 family membrane protein insertase [Chryseobacterium piscicola]
MQQNKGLDKSQMISFSVLCLVLFGFMFYFQNKQQKEDTAKAEQQKTEQVKSAVKPTQASNINSNITPGAIQTANIANNELKIEFSSLGGQVSKVELVKYKAYNQKTDVADLPLYLITKNNSNYGFQFKDKTGKVINTKDLVFTPTINGSVATMTANLNGAAIHFVYTLNNNPKAELKDQYTLDFKVRTQGLANISSDNKADFIWNYNVRNVEKGRAQEQSHSEFSYAFNNYKDYDYDGRTEMEEAEETLNWIGVKQQFFSSVIESKTGFTQSKGNQETLEEGEYLKKLNFEGFVQMQGSELNQDFTWYFMPLDLPLLKSYDKNFDEILPLGWSFIGAMNRYFFMPMYNFIAGWGLTAGWVILLMTIIVKLILSPIMYKQHKLSAMMRVIRPEIDEANAKFKDADPMKKQQATMEIYRKAGVNQMAGCLPALVQIPIFYALFRFFPNFIDLRGQGFWFAKDLTAYDDLIKLPFNVPFLGEHLSVFAIACTVVILIYTVMTSGNMQQPQQEGMPNMKVLMYIFPITFLFFLNTSASGLSWYYFVSNAINILIILVIKYLILDEKKIHAQIQANKEKPKTESKFQKRMREMMEKAQEQQKSQGQQKSNKK